MLLIAVPSVLTFAYFEAWWWLLPVLAWLGFYIWLWFTTVRAAEITRHTVTLVGVAEPFAKAIEECRANAPPASDEEDEFGGWTDDGGIG